MNKLTLAADIFNRSVDDIVTRSELDGLLSSGRKLRVKLGIDATSPDLHIGHAVALWKLRALQDAGHLAIIILGDCTTGIGDPTGRAKSRPVLSPADIRKNVGAIKRQIGGILSTKRGSIEYRKNSEWFGKMKAPEFLKLAAAVTHARLIERDMFQERMRRGAEIAVAEMLYPVLQGYDSVAVRSDLTVIGSDQLFNEHMGRFFQERAGMRPQVIVTCRILPGLEGGEKMSKSLGNYIALTDPPREKFGKAMRLVDELIIPYMETYTDTPADEIRRHAASLAAGGNPRDAKLAFAEALVRRYHGAAVAMQEREAFTALFSRKTLDAEIPTVTVRYGDWDVAELLVALSFASSKSEARRLLKQGAVKIDGAPLRMPTTSVRAGIVIQAGRRRMARIA